MNVTTTMKSNGNFVLTEGGFKFRYVDSDYDYSVLKSKKYKRTKKNLMRAKWYKENFEHDFDYAEYDCTGSTSVSIEIKIGKNYIVVYRHWGKDV